MGEVMYFWGIALIVFIIGLLLAAAISKPNSVYKNKPDMRNINEGKMVRFIEDENDPINADGKRGHLEPTGDAVHHPSIYENVIKRLIDIILSFCGLILLSPLFLIISLIIFIDDPGPVFFTQRRVGKNKQYFALHKFRSMKLATPHDIPTHMMGNADCYITKVGRFLRVSSLDELPQIWDIFIGNMTIVGPRPALWNQDVLVAERDLYHANDVIPGLTGWAQVNGRDELTIPEKARYDGEYVRNLSIVMDIRCFLKTISNVINRSGVVEGGTGPEDYQEKRRSEDGEDQTK